MPLIMAVKWQKPNLAANWPFGNQIWLRTSKHTQQTHVKPVLEMYYYFRDTIKHELERNKPLVDRILSDITYQSADNLVDGLTKLEEEGYNYAHYYGAGSQKSYKDDYK